MAKAEAQPNIFRELDRVTTELRHERKLRASAIERSRRHFCERERLVAQIRKARIQAQAAVAGDASPRATVRELQAVFGASLEVLNSIDEEMAEMTGASSNGNTEPTKPQNELLEQGNHVATDSIATCSTNTNTLNSDEARRAVDDRLDSQPVAKCNVAKNCSVSKGCLNTTAEVAKAFPLNAGFRSAQLAIASEAIQDVQFELTTPRVYRKWEPDSMACNVCNIKFTIIPLRRRHHCRQCGCCVCATCSPFRVHLDDPVKPPYMQELHSNLSFASSCASDMTELHGNLSFASSCASGNIAITTDHVGAYRVCTKCHGCGLGISNKPHSK